MSMPRLWPVSQTRLRIDLEHRDRRIEETNWIFRFSGPHSEAAGSRHHAGLHASREVVPGASGTIPPGRVMSRSASATRATGLTVARAAAGPATIEPESLCHSPVIDRP